MDKVNFGKLPGYKETAIITNPSRNTKTPAAKSIHAADKGSVRGSGTKAWSGSEKGVGKGKGAKGC